MGARTDQATDPQLLQELLTVRRGTAFWHRKVEQLMDEELDEPTLLLGWSRRHLIAHVGYNARAIARLVRWANTGVENPMYASFEQRDHEIELGATLPARALRHLDYHAAVSLNVEWRDTPEQCWDHPVRTVQGREVPLRETVWMRTREVWLHAVDLGNGARVCDIPEPVLQRLLGDMVAMWEKRGTLPDAAVEVERPDGVEQVIPQTGSTLAEPVRGDLAAVVSWASGRGAARLSSGGDTAAPRWL